MTGRVPDGARDCRLAARAALENALVLDPAHAPAWAGLSRLLRDMDDLPGSARAAELGVAAGPREADCWAALAEALLVAGRPGDALTAADQAVRLNAAHPSAHGLRGDILSALGREDDAREAWDIGGEVVEHLRAEGLLDRSWTGAIPEHVGASLDALLDDPLDPLAWTERGILLAGLADLIDIVDDARRRVAEEPRAADGWVLLADVLRDIGHLDAARDAAERATRLAPGEAWTWECLARTLRWAGHLPEALDALAALEPDDESAATAWELRGQILEDLGRHDEATADFARAFELMVQAQDRADDERDGPDA